MAKMQINFKKFNDNAQMPTYARAWDAYEEVLDLAVYIRGIMYERDGQ